jgi:hypothetical protein
MHSAKTRCIPQKRDAFRRDAMHRVSTAAVAMTGRRGAARLMRANQFDSV